MSDQTKVIYGVNPNVSVDCVIFGFDFEKLNVLLIQRKSEDGSGPEFQLPGDLIRDDETLDEAAQRVLLELTELSNIYLEQFYCFGDPNRVKREDDAEWLRTVRDKPDARVITVAYYSLVRQQDYQPQASSFAEMTHWIPVEEVPPLHFDHTQILETGIQNLKTKLRVQPIGFELLPEKFTLSQLQKLYEVILGKPLDKRNFRRKVLKLGILIELNERQSGVPHKPAQYFTFNRERYEELTKEDYIFGF